MKRSPLGLHFELPSAAQEITLGSNQACVLIQMRLRILRMFVGLHGTEPKSGGKDRRRNTPHTAFVEATFQVEAFPKYRATPWFNCFAFPRQA
jgi:hypothetical protein